MKASQRSLHVARPNLWPISSRQFLVAQQHSPRERTTIRTVRKIMRGRFQLVVLGWVLVVMPHAVEGDRAATSAETAPQKSASAASSSATDVSARLTTPKLTPACKQSVDRGTRWLISAIRRDGFVGTDIGHPPDLGCTAMVGLALLSQGNTPQAGPHRKELRRVLDAVLAAVDDVNPNLNYPTATLVQRKIGNHAHLFIAGIFLSQVLGEAPYAEQEISRALEKLVRVIGGAQKSDGTWGSESWAPVLGTVLGWISLRASSSSGMKIAAASDTTGKALLTHLKGHLGQESWMHNFYKEAASLRVLFSLNHQEEPIFQEGVKRLIKIVREDARVFNQAGGEEFLAMYLVTECLVSKREKSWEPWYPAVRDGMIRVQNPDGSWSGHHCITARTFCTAAAVMTLQAPTRFLPVSDL